MNRPEPNPDKIVVHIPEDLKSLIPDFLESKRRDLQRMRGFLQAGDLDSIKEAGHLIKGSGASYGFEELSVLGENLESAAAANQPGKVETLLDRMTRYLNRLEIVYV